jgi:hypothetical protein
VSEGRDENRVSEREAFEYAYKVFQEALEILSRDPAEQVRLNGNYNTAFELVFDVSDGRCLLASEAGYLSGRQKAAIGTFLDGIDELPFKRHSGREADAEARLASNLTDMLHPCWAPIRAQAKELMDVLASATLLNKGYFQSLW